MDKEALKKHHFWILLGLALLLMPVVLGSVIFGVAQATVEQATKVEGEKKKLSDARPKGENYLEAQVEQKRKLEARKEEVWKEVYDAQQGLIEWPPSLSHLDKLYFGDPISDEDRNAFRKADVYLAQYEQLADLIKPTELAGGFQQALRLVKWGERFPSNEDCWLALEDLCVQREMLRCVHAINQLLAEFEDKTETAQAELKERFQPAAGESVHRFVSPYWQLDIALSSSTQGKGNDVIARGALKNVSHRRLNVARIDFLLSLFDPKVTKGNPGVLAVEGDYLSVGEEIRFSGKPVKNARSQQPRLYAVTQKLDSRFVPVKRVERIALGYHSHRTADQPLVMSTMSEEVKKATAGDAAPATDAAATPAVPGGPGAAAPVGDLSVSGIDRLRYTSVTKQVRRMPIAINLVLDQAHVQDVLRALANSRLRFQTVQMHLARYRGGQSAGSSFSGPTPSISPLPPPPNPAALQGYPVPGQPTMTTAPSLSTSGAPDDGNANLVEVSVYGLASIYEKYPPRKPVDPNAAPAAAPTDAPPADPAAPPPVAPKAG